jgi:hypothetical protein
MKENKEENKSRRSSHPHVLLDSEKKFNDAHLSMVTIGLKNRCMSTRNNPHRRQKHCQQDQHVRDGTKKIQIRTNKLGYEKIHLAPQHRQPCAELGLKHGLIK